MTAVLHVLRTIPRWVELQICTDSQLVVDAILYWMKGWERRGWKTESGKQEENGDLWRELKAAMDERTGRTEVIKVPSHVDIERNKRADEMAKEGVRKHGKKMRDEKEQEKRSKQERRRGEGEKRRTRISRSGKVPRKVSPPKNQR